VHASSPLRFLRPTFPGTRAACVCIVTFGAGLIDGDAIDLDLVVEPGATLVVFGQSSTKVFRGASRQAIRAGVHGTLVLLPDPVSCVRRDAQVVFRDAIHLDIVDGPIAPRLDRFEALATVLAIGPRVALAHVRGSRRRCGRSRRRRGWCVGRSILEICGAIG